MPPIVSNPSITSWIRLEPRSRNAEKSTIEFDRTRYGITEEYLPPAVGVTLLAAV